MSDQEIEVTPTETTVVEEKFPPPSHLRIVYSASQIKTNDDPLLATVYSYCEKVLAMHYFKMEDGTIGTAFFCVMKEDWVPPTEDMTESNIKKLDEQVKEEAKEQES